MSESKRAYRQFSNDSDHSSHEGKGKQDQPDNQR